MDFIAHDDVSMTCNLSFLSATAMNLVPHSTQHPLAGMGILRMHSPDMTFQMSTVLSPLASLKTVARITGSLGLQLSQSARHLGMSWPSSTVAPSFLTMYVFMEFSELYIPNRVPSLFQRTSLARFYYIVNINNNNNNWDDNDIKC